MNNRQRGHAARLSAIWVTSLAVCGLNTAASPQTEQPEAVHTDDQKSVAPTLVVDASIDEFRVRLLDAAMDAATAIPVKPHIKDRSKSQYEVIGVCYELGLPNRAVSYAGRVDNWRRGEAFADHAGYLAKNGHADKVQQYLDLADRQAAITGDWRRDRIRVKVGSTLLYLGELDDAANIESELGQTESGKMSKVRAELGMVDLAAQLAAVDTATQNQNFDFAKHALQGCVRFFDVLYDDVERRTIAEQKIKQSWDRLPIMIRLELMTDLVEIALKHDDQRKAISLLDEAQLIFESYRWTYEFHIGQRAQFARLRFLAGDVDRARSEADQTLALFEANRDKIVNVWRAGALRPLAVAYQTMGKTPNALLVYAMALEEGVVNPNARPRAMDLAATCASMASSGVEPNEDVWNRIRQIMDGLSDPW